MNSLHVVIVSIMAEFFLISQLGLPRIDCKWLDGTLYKNIITCTSCSVSMLIPGLDVR